MRPIIYQAFTRLFGSQCASPKRAGALSDNGCGKMADFTPAVLRRIHKLGATYLWPTGIIRHATATDYTAYGIPAQCPAIVKGKAGSPYAITDYYDIDPDIAVKVPERMKEFEAFVRRIHEAEMKVVIDFVPNHVARQYKSVAKPAGVRDLGQDDDTGKHFSPTNNFYYCWGQPFRPDIPLDGYTEQPARATGNDHFDASPGRFDWYETVKLNYGIDYLDAGGRSVHFDPIPNTWDKMTGILLFWASKGVDAFRCDMAEMVPAEFWAWATDKVRYRYPDIKFIGEVYNPALYRTYIHAGFDWLYDKVGLYDCLLDATCGRRPASDITRQWQATDDIAGHMLYFLENHDEQRLASDFQAGNGLRGLPALVVAALMRNNPFMLYAGQEFGERGMDEEGYSGCDGRTTIFDYWTVPTLRAGYYHRSEMTEEAKTLEALYTKVLNIARTESAITEGQFYDLMYRNQHIAGDIFAFLRSSAEELMLVVANFADGVREVDINIPQHAFDFLGIEAGTRYAFDMIGGHAQTVQLDADTPYHTTLDAKSAKVIILR